MDTRSAFATPWKILVELMRFAQYPLARTYCVMNGVAWKRGWRLYGLPVIMRHLKSEIQIGHYLVLRSSLQSNPLGPQHAVILCTWQAGAVLKIGDHFGMSGGTIYAANRITIGDNVLVGANSTIIDTDSHPLHPGVRRVNPQAGHSAPVVIEDDVFIGMNCLILKGVHIGKGSVVGAGSVVTKDVPAGSMVAGNPAKEIGLVQQ